MHVVAEQSSSHLLSRCFLRNLCVVRNQGPLFLNGYIPQASAAERSFGPSSLLTSHFGERCGGQFTSRIEDGPGVNRTPYPAEMTTFLARPASRPRAALQPDIRIGWGSGMGKQLTAPPPHTMSSPPPNIYAHLALSQDNAQREDVPTYKLSKKPSSPNPKPTADLPVCIIGAGMAGLYTAMIFQSLGIPYHIVDANTEKRLGGRIFTHRFDGGIGYDYFVSRFCIDAAS